MRDTNILWEENPSQIGLNGLPGKVRRPLGFPVPDSTGDPSNRCNIIGHFVVVVRNAVQVSRRSRRDRMAVGLHSIFIAYGFGITESLTMRDLRKYAVLHSVNVDKLVPSNSSVRRQKRASRWARPLRVVGSTAACA